MPKLWACVNDVINELKVCLYFVVVHDGVKPADHTALKNVVRFISAFVKSSNDFMQ